MQVVNLRNALKCWKLRKGQTLTSNIISSISERSLHNLKTSLEKKMTRNLAAFDFDHTIVDENTDIVVRDLIPKENIPVSLKKLYKNDGWTAYMQGVFELLHLNGQNENEINTAVMGIPATEGMPELIRKLSEELNYDVIIISDSNSYLINTWLDRHDLQNNILQVFTNPAKFDKGVLRLEMYHLQTDCKLSTKNLCKGKILDDFVKKRKDQNVSYKRIIYIGDGTNDFCPILRLGEKDLACVRDKHNCIEIVKKVKDGKPIASTGETYEIKANILVWNTGYEILEALQN